MGAQETSDSFNDEVLREQDVFNLAKRAEMKVPPTPAAFAADRTQELLTSLADGHIALYKASIEAFDRAEPSLAKIRTL